MNYGVWFQFFIFFWLAPFARISQNTNSLPPNIALWPYQGPMDRLWFLMKILLALLWLLKSLGEFIEFFLIFKWRVFQHSFENCKKTLLQIFHYINSQLLLITTTFDSPVGISYHDNFYGTPETIFYILCTSIWLNLCKVVLHIFEIP